ncbi:YnjH family protein [Vibrio fluvialis]|uniref:YnjH family protein n=1 Tax=Vibrio fluvialis TaxID=676 RepID=UPI00155966D4|nr:YnjH family protein [Vibrio fluvialis]EKO3957200.1 YnjH family protein [Vibrio fluvialis]
MIKSIGVFTAIVIASTVQANTVSTSTQQNTLLMDGSIGKRVCYYEDKAYSEGSVVQIGQVYMVCQRANDFETNGPLKWVVLQQEKPKAP